MNYSSKSGELQKARSLVGSAIQTRQRHRRLRSCRALLRELDPDRPPATAKAREFNWQYRALLERVHMLSERLSSIEEQERVSDYHLEKAEVAVCQSLRYFHDVLATPQQSDDEEDGPESTA